MIGIDWGTSSFRAWRMEADGSIADRIAAPRGILTVEPGTFPTVLDEIIGPWLRAGEDLVLVCGMAGSRQGWQEAAYLPCPADARALAGALTPVEFPTARVLLVPGLSCRDAAGVPEVMRGEETKILGLLDRLPAGPSLVLSPGSHSKWATVQDGTVLNFVTQFTGEAFATLSANTILARTLDRDAPEDAAAFEEGLARARQSGGLLHHLFGLRARFLFGELTEAAAASYLSGMLLGHEVVATLPEGTEHVVLVGEGGMMGRYARALRHFGVATTEVPEEAAAAGLYRIAASLKAVA
jgi:2-dehydro-3-deoxygalactonokinase